MANKYIAFSGGLDLASPRLETKGGSLVEAFNCYESVKGGYTTIAGFEAYSGLPSPAEAADEITAELRRNAINPLEGSGSIRGVAQILGTVLAWRNSGGLSLCYRATQEGWELVPYADGFAPVALTKTSISYVNHNFYGGKDTFHCYFGDGVNQAQWYDPVNNIITPIADSGIVAFVAAFSSRLLMSTTGGTFIASVEGDPTDLDGTLDALEIGVGDEITGMHTTASNTLAIYTTRNTYGLSGTSANIDWQLKLISQNAGARPHCVAQTDDVFASDDRGIYRLSRTETLGGFGSATITDDIQPLFIRIAQKSTCATTIRRLNQMRFFYGTACIIASQIEYNSGGKMSVRYGMTEASFPGTPVLCVSTEEDPEGFEKTFFGSEDGFIYQMDKGTSHNGKEIPVKMTLAFNHFGTPTVNKRFMGIGLEAVLTSPTEFDCDYSMDDGLKEFEYRTAVYPDGSSSWGFSEFGDATYGSRPISRDKISLKGTGYNIQFSFSRNSALDAQATLTGYTIRLKERGQVAL